MGLWYNDEVRYEAEVTLFLQWMHDLAPAGVKNASEGQSEPRGRSLAVFLESFPQHIPVPKQTSGPRLENNHSSSDGSTRGAHTPSSSSHPIRYSVPLPPQEFWTAASRSPEKHSCCIPITNYSQHADWRNRIVHAVTARHCFRMVSILPVAEAFKPAHNMHTCGGDRVDCTHYCFWPMQLQFEWHTLAKVVQKQCIGVECI